MRLTVRLLGIEVLYVDTEAEPPPGEGEGVELSRHQGTFELGFQPSVRWSATERDGDGP